MNDLNLPGLSTLIERLMDEDEDVRYDSARTIAFSHSPRFETILGWSKDAQARMREMACFILGCSGKSNETGSFALIYPQAIPTLITALEDADNEVRITAVGALGSHHVPDTIPALLRLVSDPSENMRYAVACALGSFYEQIWDDINRHYKPQVEEALLQLMDDEDDDVRDWATFGIHQGGHAPPQSRARLWKALDDRNSNVKGEAAEGLAIFGDRSLIPRLETLLGDQNELSPCYFLAAAELGDPILLPAAVDAARRWRAWGDENDWFIDSTIETLTEVSKANSRLEHPE